MRHFIEPLSIIHIFKPGNCLVFIIKVLAISGIAISCNCTDRTISISPTALIDCVVQQFGQSEADPISTPMDPSVARSLTCPSPSDPPLFATDTSELARLPYQSLVGSLMYLAVGTQPDISFAVACCTPLPVSQLLPLCALECRNTCCSLP